MAWGNWFAGGLNVLAAVVMAWTAMAWRSGQFIPHDGRWAVAPGEVAPIANLGLQTRSRIG